MPATIGNLGHFGLTLTALHRLGDRRVRAGVMLDSHKPTPAVIRLPPSDRLAYLAAQAERWFDQIQRKFPRVKVRGRGGTDVITELDAVIRADEVRTLRRCRGVGWITLESVAGVRKRVRRSPRLGWYCVHGRVAIQIEGRRRGMQTVEDRYVLVKAASEKDAERRLAHEWLDYGRPYFNPDGERVRWQLEKIVDVRYADDVIDPAGQEVYYRLSERRMRPEHVWRPAK